MAQIWVNLPKDHKMKKPRYQGIDASSIPVVHLYSEGKQSECSQGQPTAEARVIAGSLEGIVGPAQTVTPIEMWDVRVGIPEDKIKLPVPEGENRAYARTCGSCKAFVRPLLF